MWSRKELKTSAKQLLKLNYWKAVVVGIVLSFLQVSGTASGSNAAKDSDLSSTLASLDHGSLVMAIRVIWVAIAVSAIIHLVLKILLWNPLEVGCQKFYLNCKTGDSKMKDMLFAFKNRYAHVGVVMLFRAIFTFLWGLLLIIPGIVKSYEYMMIPYIPADDPTVSRKDAFAQSKAMMKGIKWSAFVLDLSFIGWILLSLVTLGLVGIFYAEPYMNLTHAELYYSLKERNAATAAD